MMNLRVPEDYKTSCKYKMVLILKMFRKGLKLTSRQIGEEMCYTMAHICNTERGMSIILDESLKKYADIIAKKMNFQKHYFYSELEHEVAKMQDINQSTLLRAFSNIICYNTILYDRKTINIYDDIKSEIVLYNAFLILSCFRRIMDITTDAVGKEIGFDVSEKKEKRNFSLFFVKKYASFFANKLQCDEEMLYRKLLKQAHILEEEPNEVAIMLATADIIEAIYYNSK